MKTKKDILVNSLLSFSENWKKKGIKLFPNSDNQSKIMRSRYERDSEEVKEIVTFLRQNSFQIAKNKFDSLTEMTRSNIPSNVKQYFEIYGK